MSTVNNRNNFQGTRSEIKAAVEWPILTDSLHKVLMRWFLFFR